MVVNLNLHFSFEESRSRQCYGKVENKNRTMIDTILQQLMRLDFYDQKEKRDTILNVHINRKRCALH
jgi:hypothetical protein